MTRGVLPRLLDMSPIWPVCISIALGVSAFFLIRYGVVAGAVSALVLPGVVVLPVFGGYVWHHESSSLGRAAGAALVLLVGGSAGFVVMTAVLQ